MAAADTLTYNSNNPHNVPDFDKVTADELYKAIQAGAEKIKAKVSSMQKNTAAPGFKDDVEALDSIFKDIEGPLYIFHTLANSASDRLDQSELFGSAEEIEAAVGKLADEADKAVFQNEVLAARFKTVYDTPAMAFDKQIPFFMEKMYEAFERQGAFLSAEQKAAISKIDNELTEATASFESRVKKSTEAHAIIVTDENDLEGLSEDIKNQYLMSPEGRSVKTWKIVPDRFVVPAIASQAENRAFRKRLFDSLARVGTDAENDTQDVALKILKLRHERSQIMGYDNYAQFAVKPTMAKTVENVNAFLAEILLKGVDAYDQDYIDLQKFAEENGGPETLEPWDIPFWAAKYREEKFDFSEKELKPYMECSAHVDGFFDHAAKLFDLNFNERDDIPAYHEDVRVFEVANKDAPEKCIGLVYVDPFKRSATKRGGAWMSTARPSGEDGPVVITMNMNFEGKGTGKGTLLDFGSLETLYHEGGHVLHGLLGANTKYKSMAGTAGTPDFTELQSQVQENWIGQPATAKLLMKHYQTGEAPSDELMERWVASRNFMASSTLLMATQNAWMDMMIHQKTPEELTSLEELFEESKQVNPYAAHVRAYPLNWFSHPFSSPLSQYAAGYYGYTWSQALDSDAFKPFENDPYNPEMAAKLKKLYQQGSSLPYDEIYREYRGKDMELGAMFERVGIPDKDIDLEEIGMASDAEFEDKKLAPGLG
ncbi:MAG: hypothetical protein CMH28_02580 [Micavibrio sp.]|nr:hypothetical protein [Micavibrio sp.]